VGVVDLDKELDMKTIIRWLFGVCFIFLSLTVLSTSFLGAILMLICGLFILPLSGNIIFNKLGLQDNTKAKWGIVIALLAVGTLITSSAGDKKATSILEQAEDLINNEAIDEAKQLLIDKADENEFSDKFTQLKSRIDKASDKDFQLTALGKMTDDEFKLLEEKRLEKTYFESKALNKYFKAKLYENRAERERLVAERERLLAEEKANIAKNNRTKLIEKQFSSWDGSHRGLTRLIKESMHNPDSYEHVETRFRDDGKSIFVITEYRGTNAFGGTVVGSISAIVDFDGNVIEVVSQN